MQSAFKYVHAWLFQLRGPEHGEVVLVQRRIFILPTRAGVGFALVLILMLVGSINYSLSLGFVLTFMLGSVGFTAMLHTFRNLAGLRITPGRTQPVFAGENARFSVCLQNPTRSERFSITLTRNKVENDVVDIPGESVVVATAAVPATRRGLLRPGRLTVYTRFPVGLYYAWSYVELDTHCVVYPKPAPPGVPLPALAASSAEGAGPEFGSEDFAGLRQYQPGDSVRHIAWKAVARGDVLLTKQFSGRATAELWLSLELLPDPLDLETKISRLARWVLDAHTSGLAYGLKLPGATIAMSRGEAHRDRCLEALALV
jgi:uncharacterized protein (DUF58 family)